MSQRPANTPSGFQGSASLPLVDLLQVWASNGLSGLVTVTSGGSSGHLYFVDGAVVHAEAGGAKGEAAVRTILSWPEGTFELAPNTTTLERTIQKGMSHLILDALRVIDETGPAAPAPAVPAPPPPAAAPAARGVLDQLRAIPGVARLVHFGKDGRPVGSAGPEAEALAAKGLYVAVTHAAFVAAAFGLRDLRTATVHGARESFVLVQGNGSSICAEAAPGAAADAIAAQMRTLLARPAAR